MNEKDFDAIYKKMDELQLSCTHQIRRLRDLDLTPDVYAEKRVYLRTLYRGLTLALAVAKRYERMYSEGHTIETLVDLMRDMIKNNRGAEADGLHLGLYYMQKLVKE